MKYIYIALIAALLSICSACNAPAQKAVFDDLNSITFSRELSYAGDRVVDQTIFKILKTSSESSKFYIPICNDIADKFREISIFDEENNEMNWEHVKVDNRSYVAVDLSSDLSSETINFNSLAINVANPVLFKKNSALRFDTHLFYDLPYSKVEGTTKVVSTFDELLINDEATDKRSFESSEMNLSDTLSITLFQTAPNLYVEELNTTIQHLPISGRARVIHSMKFFNKVAPTTTNYLAMNKWQYSTFVTNVAMSIPSAAENVRVYDRNGLIYDFSFTNPVKLEQDWNSQADKIIEIKPRYPIRPNERAGFSVEFDVSTKTPKSLIFKNKDTKKYYLNTLVTPFFKPEATVLKANYFLKLGAVVKDAKLIDDKFVKLLPQTTHKSTFLQRGSQQINMVSKQLLSSDLLMLSPLQFEWSDSSNHVFKAFEQLFIGFGIIAIVYKVSLAVIEKKNEEHELYAAASRAVNI